MSEGRATTGESAFVMFRQEDAGLVAAKVTDGARRRVCVNGPWMVSFAYHEGITATPPAAVKMEVLKESERVTRSNLHYWTGERKAREGSPKWNILPTVYSGYTTTDPLQSAGLLGPIELH